jgi:hypothetical protein
MKDSHELARLCSLDIGKEVTSEDVRALLLSQSGGRDSEVLGRFTEFERQEINATLLKELSEASPEGEK